MTPAELKDARYKARTDLFYLATQVLGYALVPEVHRPVTDFFLQKDPTKGLYEQSDKRSRLLLDPRGHFKTTIDVCDVIQWIICFPDVRILLVSGATELAERMLNEVKFHFLANTNLRTLFPEYAINEKKKGRQHEFTSPARANGRLREPTVSISTIDSIKAGSHFDVIKFDDVVNEVNSQNKEQIQKCIDGFNHLVPILEPGGYKDVIGTRYNFSDLYGWIIDHNDGEWEVLKREACSLPLMKNSTILFRKDARGQERFNYRILDKIRNDDPYLFSCQYLNDPSNPDDASFTKQLLEASFRPKEAIFPLFFNTDLMGGKSFRTGSVFCAWDLAFSEKKQNDFTCGVAGLFDRAGRIWIVDLVMGRFTPHELLNEVLGMALRWRPYLNRIVIENSAGSKLLEASFPDRFQRMNWYPYVEWVPTNPKVTKHERIYGIHPLLKNGLLFFSNDLPHKDDLIKQFIRFPHFSHDDVPDAVSMLLPYKPIGDAAQLVPVPTPQAPEPTYESNPLGWGFVG